MIEDEEDTFDGGEKTCYFFNTNAN